MYEKELEKAIELAKAAAARVMVLYNTEYEIATKDDDSPVTKADLAANNIILQGLKEFGYGIISEETGVEKASAGLYWVVDPLDGTKDFIQKTDEFSVMIGLLNEGRPVMGVVSIPASGKIYYAVENQGSYLIEADGRPQKISVSDTGDVVDYRMVVSRNHFRDEMRMLAEKLGVSKFKSMGSFGYKVCAIAAGEAELCVYTPPTHFGYWDCCAPEIILKEAGGDIADVYGYPLDYDLERMQMDKGIVAMSGKNRGKIMEALGEVLK